jgi:hypothetical protein
MWSTWLIRTCRQEAQFTAQAPLSQAFFSRGVFLQSSSDGRPRAISCKPHTGHSFADWKKEEARAKEATTQECMQNCAIFVWFAAGLTHLIPTHCPVMSEQTASSAWSGQDKTGIGSSHSNIRLSLRKSAHRGSERQRMSCRDCRTSRPSC